MSTAPASACLLPRSSSLVVSGRAASRRSRFDRDALIEQNYKLVHFVVNRYFAGLSPTEPDDAESVGYLALVGAAERYEAVGGGAFSTFATRTIWGAISKYYRRSVRSRGFTAVRDVELPAGAVVSLDATTTGASLGETAVAWAERVPDTAEVANVVGTVQTRADLRAIWGVAERYLLPAEAELLRLRYLDDLGLREIADRQGVSYQAVANRQKAAIAKLRRYVVGASG